MMVDDPNLTLTRAGVHGLTASVPVPVHPRYLSGQGARWILATPALGSVRRRAALERDVRVLAAAQGEYRGLHLPGQAAVRHTWHPRLDVVLLEDELRIAGNGLLARFPLPEMVLATYSTEQRGAMRVDLLGGSHVSVRVRDQGQLMERLRNQIWEYEKALVADASDIDWALDVSPVRLAEAEAAMDAADARLRATGNSLQQDRIAQDLVARSVALRREARVDAIRQRRQRMRCHTDA